MMPQSNTTYADLDEMLFENRERMYGAYELRQHYPWRLFTALAMVMVLFFWGAVAPVCVSWMGERNIPALAGGHPEHPDFPPLPEEEIPALSQFSSHKHIPKIPETFSFQPNIHHMIDELDEKYLSGEEVGCFCGIIDDKERLIRNPEFMDEKEGIEPRSEYPVPVNLSEIKRLISYPVPLRRKGIKGMMVVRVLIDEFGQYQQHRVIREIHPLFTQAVEKQLPGLRFTPAVQGTEPVSFWVHIPIKVVE